MGIKESALAAMTTITQSDLIRAVTAAGASRRITVANLAKAIIENYTGSSLAGSSQSVKAALDSLNSNFTGITVTKTYPATVQISPYKSFIMSGLAQGIGNVVILVLTEISLSTIIDMTTGQPFSNPYLTFEYTNGTLTISSTLSSISAFRVLWLNK